jgi:nitrogen fixation/metabolism regulation signal transduction histidine kinase
MAVAKRLRRALLAALATAGILLWFVALVLLTEAAENSDDFARIIPWIIVINAAGITVLVILIVVNVTQLIKDHRQHVPGSRLRARLVMLLVMLAVIPLLGVYFYAVEFVNRSIDDWLNPDLKESLALAVESGQDLLEERTRERREQTAAFAAP